MTIDPEVRAKIIELFTVDGKRPVALGMARNGHPKKVTQKFLDFCDAHKIDMIDGLTSSQMLRVIVCGWTISDLTCPECGSLKNIQSKQLPVFCSSTCYKSSESGRQAISRSKAKLYSDPKWKERTEAKKIATNRKKLGVDHPMQDPECFEKQKISSFQAVKRNGLLLQGYEEQISKFLSTLNYTLQSGHEYIKTVLGKLEWFDDQGITHRTYPDFYVPELNGFVEVKGQYTRDKDDIKIQRTADACKELGLTYFVVVYKEGCHGSCRIMIEMLSDFAPE